MWRGGERAEVAVVMRDRHSSGECSLPKGKLDDGEAWEEAALREVLEETCCEARIVGFGGLALYYVGTRPKAVVYFELQATRERRFRPSPEVRALSWLEPEAALLALTYDSEREILRKCLALARRPARPGSS